MGLNRKGIDRLFTEKVKEHLDDGWLILTPPAGGHQGEIAKVFLAKGKIVRIVLLENYYSPISDDIRFSGITLTVGEIDNKKYHDLWRRNSDTIWISDIIETLYSKTFFEIQNGCYCGCHWWGTKEEAIHQHDVYMSRIENDGWKRRKDWTDAWAPKDMSAARKVLLPLLRDLPKMKTVKEKDIDYIRRTRCRDIGGALRSVEWDIGVRGQCVSFICPANGEYFIRMPDGYVGVRRSKC